MNSDRRFIHDPARLVREASLAILQQQPGLELDAAFSVLHKSNLSNSDRVTVISGGGSGHEPAHAGYVGDGMLDAAVIGAIFASPNVRQIYRGLEGSASSKGTVLIVKNYTGDKLNFALAAEQFKSATGNDVRLVLVADDVAVGRSRGKFVGRRGLAGTVLIQKIAGAAAQRGTGLDEIVSLCDGASRNMGTFGVSLSPCSVPGQQPAERLGAKEEIELGMGIHNEHAIRSLPAETETSEVIQEMLRGLLDASDSERAYLPADAAHPARRLILMINNLGGLSVLELNALTHLVTVQLRETYGLTPCRTYSGTFLSALDGRGFSITLLSLDDSDTSTTILSLLDDPTTAPGWTSSVPSAKFASHSSPSGTDPTPETPQPLASARNIPCDGEIFAKIIRSIYQEVVAAEPDITRYDSVLGDGDCGTTLLAGAQAMIDGLNAGTLATNNLGLGMATLAELVTDAMGGTSGGIYGIYLSALAAALAQLYKEGSTLDIVLFADAANRALDVLQQFTGARVGDRTLMDALIPFVLALAGASKENTATEVILEALAKAQAGCAATCNLEFRFGRSAYVNEEHGVEKSDGETVRLPDPGACGVVAVLRGLSIALL